MAKPHGLALAPPAFRASLLVTPQKVHDGFLCLGFGSHEVQKGVGREEINLPVWILARKYHGIDSTLDDVGSWQLVHPKLTILLRTF